MRSIYRIGIYILAALPVYILAQPPQAPQAQHADPDANLPDYEKRIPAGDYCKHEGVPIGPKETHAHSCSCKYICQTDENGNLIEAESNDCLAYCHANGRKCTCHVEEPCPDGAALQSQLVDPSVVDWHATAKTYPGHTAEVNERINGQRVRLQQGRSGQWTATK